MRLWPIAGALGIAKKRFTLTAKGKVRPKLANTAHRLVSKAKSAKLRNRASEKLDVTLASLARPAGHIHPISQTIEELTQIFAEVGFAVTERARRSRTISTISPRS